MSYTDLTDTWSNGKLLTHQLFQNIADNDLFFYLKRGMLLYENFEDYYRMIDHGFEVSYDLSANAYFLASYVSDDNKMFGSYAGDFSESDSFLLLSMKKRNCHEEGSISFWFRNGNKNGVMFETIWGLKIRLSSLGYLDICMKDTEGTEFDVIGDTDRSGDTDWHHAVAIWRCKGDGSDKLKLFFDGSEEGDELIKQTIKTPPNHIDAYSMVGCGKNEFNWTKTEDGVDLPTENGWTFTTSKSGGIEKVFSSVDDGLLTIDTSSDESSQYDAYYSIVPTVDFSIGFTAEWRMRITDEEGVYDSNGFFTVRIDDDTNDERVRIKFYRHCIQFFHGASTKNYWIDTYDVTRVYKIEVSGTTWSFYINGKKVLTGTTYSQDPGADLVSFGNESTTWFCTTEIDYFKYHSEAIVTSYSSVMGGQMDDLALWNRAITSGEISAIYNSGTGASIASLAGMSTFDIEKLNWMPPRSYILHLPAVTASTATDTTVDGTLVYFTQGSYPIYVQLNSSLLVAASTDIHLEIDNIEYNELEALNMTSGYTPIRLHALHFGGKGVVPIKAEWDTGSSNATLAEGCILIKEVK